MDYIEFKVPDLIEPIVGWRGWRLHGDMLMGMHFPVIWEPEKPLIADSSYCGINHEIPGENCMCGIHATKDREGLRLNYLMGLPDIYGTVSLWGRVAIHSRGYRAEFAYPKELWVSDERLIKVLGWYNVPIIMENL